MTTSGFTKKVFYAEPVHSCSMPMMNWDSGKPDLAPGTVWKCECGKSWLFRKIKQERYFNYPEWVLLGKDGGILEREIKGLFRTKFKPKEIRIGW